MAKRPLSRHGLPRLAFTCLVTVLTAMAAPAAGSEPIECDAAIRSALRALSIEPDELHLSVSHVESDERRLSIVDSLLAHPLRAAPFLDTLAASRLGVPSTDRSAVLQAWWDYSALLDLPAPLWGKVTFQEELAGTYPSTAFGGDLKRVVRELRLVAELHRSALNRLDPADVALLRERSVELLAQQADDTSLGVLEFRERERQGEAFRDSIHAAAGKVVMRYLLGTGRILQLTNGDASLIKRVSRRWEDQQGEETEPPPALRDQIDGRIRFATESRSGWIVIGGKGTNRYEGDFALIIEPGGDDVYDLAPAGGGEASAVRAVFDLGGDDRYRGRGPGSLGAGYLGVGLLYDEAGDDIYEAGPANLGVGWLGIGVLWDRAGKDRYLAGSIAQGVGFYGIGVLRDDEGDDLYQASLHAQGFGFVGGVGALEEGGGNDLYLIQPEEVSVLHYNDRTYSMAQGASFGERPDYSGGIGLLLDGGGNDSYIADLFAQGTSYWLGIGGLWDRSGHDHYTAHQYAQGSGVHLAIGLLLDGAGDDTYQSKGVSQGVGHDLAFGMLRDLRGNDTYAAHDLSQGAGNANGIGILVDASGIDAYIGKNEQTVLGYGNYRREYESVGLALDLLGDDFRAPRGKERSAWFSGTVGVGADWPGEMSPQEATSDTFKVPLEEGDYTDEELLLMARSGEPRFSLWRTMGTEALAARGEDAVAFLVTRLGTDNARERHTLKDIFCRMGTPPLVAMMARVPALGERERAQAAWIIGETRDAAAIDPLTAMLDDPSARVRAPVMAALGKVWDEERGASAAASLGARAARALAEDDEAVAKEAAFLLGAIRADAGLAALVEGLARPGHMVRTACRLALQGYGPRLPRYLQGRDELPEHALVIATLLQLAADGEPSAWEPLLPRLLAVADLSNESVAVAAARLIVARRGADPSPSLDELARKVRDGSSELARLVLDPP